MRHATRFIFFVIVSSALPLYAQSSIQELNEAGWKALEAGNGRRALGLFNEALTLRPNDPVLLTGAGAALQAEGRPRDAMVRLKQAVALKPDLTVASILLGDIAFDEGDAALAIKTYENALKFNRRTGARVEAARVEAGHRNPPVLRISTLRPVPRDVRGPR
jgi:tetratricopeptide (TPR) repeat protein